MSEHNQACAISHVGNVRPNNQDSGYAGAYLFAVADGMGGHVGGDVASTLAIEEIKKLDLQYDNPEQALHGLESCFFHINEKIKATAEHHPDLTGMGTTLSAAIRFENTLALAHIGDSRIYCLRDQTLTQLTSDHTFVQRLIDNGKITEEEARVHPRRSVLIRVLGDSETSIEVDTQLFDVLPGDRWLFCSDGLSGVLADSDLEYALTTIPDQTKLLEELIDKTLNQGAPDNITAIVVDIGNDDYTEISSHAQTVGSARKSLQEHLPESFSHNQTRALKIQPSTPPVHQSKAPEQPTGFLDKAIIEEKRRQKRHRLFWLISASIATLLLFFAGLFAYRWTQSQFYVAPSSGHVAIFQGVEQTIGPFSLSRVYYESEIPLYNLSSHDKSLVESRILAQDLASAQKILKNLEYGKSR